MFQTGEVFKSDIHDATVVVIREFGGTVQYVVVDCGRTQMATDHVYHVAASEFYDWYVHRGVKVSRNDERGLA